MEAHVACQISILADALDLKYEPLTCLKNFLINSFKATIF
jgi:hypothetical protein